MKTNWRLMGCLLISGVLAGCGPDEITETLQNAAFDVGGAVVYAGDAELPIADVAIEIKDINDKAYDGTTNAAGLWTIPNLREGAYTLTYTKTGYKSSTAPFTLDALGENDFENMFIGLGTHAMRETQLQADIGAPFNVTLVNGDFMAHGGPQTIEYSMSGDSIVTVDFNKPLYGGDFSVRISGQLGTIYAVPDQGRTHWTFTVPELNSALMADTNDFTLSTFQIVGAFSYTDIHDEVTAVNAEILFDCVP